MTSPSDPVDFGFALNDEAWLDKAREALHLEGWESIGEYQILQEVSRGGQGVVLRARDAEGRIVAIKRLLAGTFTGTRGRLRFEREMEIAARLQHPFIVSLLRREIIDRQPLLVMPWIEGLPPDQWARPAAGKERSRREILVLMDRVCQAVQHAHQRGVIHRDLKPSNILVDAQDRPHVLDFGIGKLLAEGAEDEPALTQTTEFVGSPTYAPPERLLGESRLSDVRDDVYSLGVLLYELLSGTEPYPFGETLASAIQALQNHEPTPLQKVVPGLEGDLATIVHKAIAKDPSMRFASVEALQADLRRFLRGEAVLARGPSHLYRLSKFLKRHMAASLLGLVLLISLLAFGLHSQNQAKRLKVEQAQATAQSERARDALGFLLDEIFPQLNPRHRGRSASVPEILRQAAASLTGRFDTAPDLELEIRMAIGELQLRHGDYSGASQQLDRAAAIHAQLAEDAQSRIRSRKLALLSAEAHYHQANWDLAERELERARAFLDPPFPSQNQHQVESLLIRLKLAAGDMASAETLCLNQIADLESAPEAQNLESELWQSRLLLISVYRGSGRAAAAVEIAESLVETVRSRYPDGHHLQVADAVRELGWSRFHAGQLQEAEAPLREALQLRRRLHGSLHPDVARSLVDVATWMQFFGRDPKQIQNLFEEAVAILRAAGAGRQQLVAGAWSGLATLAADNGDFERAERLFKEALDLLTFRLGDQHPMLANLYLDLALMETARNGFEEARTWFSKIEALHRSRGGGHLNNPTLWMAMGRNEEGAEALEEAAEYFQKAADALLIQVPQGCVPMVVCYQSLARIHRRLGRDKEAAEAQGQVDLWSHKLGLPSSSQK